ncbi:MAG: ornithine carbamoyltransferase, partial [Clostridia bacterium]
GLTDYAHPCQVLADLMTIRERKGCLKGLKLCFVGDGNNMANSLIVGCIKVGMAVRVACPAAYQPDAQIMRWAKENGDFLCEPHVMAMSEGADVLYTDVWASMGQEEEAAKRRMAFAGYQVNAEVMQAAQKDAMVQHCLPAHRGEEITEDVLEAHADEIFEEAENRLHAQKAVMVTLMK